MHTLSEAGPEPPLGSILDLVCVFPLDPGSFMGHRFRLKFLILSFSLFDYLLFSWIVKNVVSSPVSLPSLHVC